MAQRSRALMVVRTAVRLRLLTAAANKQHADGDGDGVVVDPEAALHAALLSPPAADPSTSENNVAGSTHSHTAAPSTVPSPKALSQLSPEEERATLLELQRTIGSSPRKNIVYQDLLAIWQLITSSWINVLLVFVPLAVASELLEWSAVARFSLNICALVPLALLLGNVTEDLALRFGDTIGGLINASFGNAVEIIISISALQRELYTVVSMSLLGSVLSNLLLVLGCCMLFGGVYHKTQAFNEVGNRTCSALLFLSAISLLLPTAAEHLIDPKTLADPEGFILYASRITAVLMLMCYGFYLFFQLHSHKEMFEGEEGGDAPVLSVVAAFTMLTVITLIVAYASEALTGSIEEVTKTTHISEAFLGIIVLPIAGNACEHVTAVIVAMKNKMDLALGVAVGSSIQISFFAIPVCVLVGWATGHNFTLAFDSFSALALTLAIIQVNFITSDATSHWLMGVQLLVLYVLIGAIFFFRIPPNEAAGGLGWAPAALAGVNAA